jgi:predicted anti-sigma-YlaC factor YlaD
MDCRIVVESLSSYLDGSLFEHEISSIDGHLSNCHKCSAVHSDLLQIRMTARCLPQYDPPSHIWYQIKERVALETPSIPEGAGAAKQSWWQRIMSASYTVTLPQMVGAGAMAILVALGSGVVSRHNLRRNDSGGTSQGADTGADTMGMAALPFEQPFRDGISRQLSSINVQRASWDPQIQEGFDRRLERINEALRSCRLNVLNHPGDSDSRQLIISLYEEESQFLADVERMK